MLEKSTKTKTSGRRPDGRGIGIGRGRVHIKCCWPESMSGGVKRQGDEY